MNLDITVHVLSRIHIGVNGFPSYVLEFDVEGLELDFMFRDSELNDQVIIVQCTGEYNTHVRYRTSDIIDRIVQLQSNSEMHNWNLHDEFTWKRV